MTTHTPYDGGAEGRRSALADLQPRIDALVAALQAAHAGLDALLTTPLRGAKANAAIGIAKQARETVRDALKLAGKETP